jgi:hypothetical protein
MSGVVVPQSHENSHGLSAAARSILKARQHFLDGLCCLRESGDDGGLALFRTFSPVPELLGQMARLVGPCAESEAAVTAEEGAR